MYPQETFKRSGFKAVAECMAKNYGLDAPLILTELEDIMQQKGASYPLMFNELAERLNINQKSIQQMVQVFIEHEPTIYCFPGVHAILDRLRKRYKLGLLTDGRLAVQRRKIRALGIDTIVDEILCSDSLGLEKPASKLFQWFERKFEMPGKSLMYVGDNPEKDFYGANLRSWTTVCVMTPKRRDVDCKSTFESYHKIPSVINLEQLLI